MTSAFIGGLTFQRGSGASPQVYSTVVEVTSLGGFGKTNPLVDVTSHDSTAREYIAGLADGSELSVEGNRVHSSPSVQDALIADVDAGTTRNFKITLTDGTTAIVYTFDAVCLSWTITPSFDDKATIAYALKITGAITVA